MFSSQIDTASDFSAKILQWKKPSVHNIQLVRINVRGVDSTRVKKYNIDKWRKVKKKS